MSAILRVSLHIELQGWEVVRFASGGDTLATMGREDSAVIGRTLVGVSNSD